MPYYTPCYQKVSIDGVVAIPEGAVAVKMTRSGPNQVLVSYLMPYDPEVEE